MSNYKYVEVKCITDGIYPSKAQEIVDKGVQAVISNGKISDTSKQIFDEAGVWYRENVEPSDLEAENTETETESENEED